jgi:hypothetical protein
MTLPMRTNCTDYTFGNTFIVRYMQDAVPSPGRLAVLLDIMLQRTLRYILDWRVITPLNLIQTIPVIKSFAHTQAGIDGGGKCGRAAIADPKLFTATRSSGNSEKTTRRPGSQR